MMILNLSESLSKLLVMAKQNMTYLSSNSASNQQNCCRPHCRCHHLGYSVPPAHHCTIWCRSTFGPRGPGLSNPTSFLRPALPMAPKTPETNEASSARNRRHSQEILCFIWLQMMPLECGQGISINLDQRRCRQQHPLATWATLSRDFMLYMTTNDAIRVWSRYFDQFGSKKMSTAAPARYVHVSADTRHPHMRWLALMQ